MRALGAILLTLIIAFPVTAQEADGEYEAGEPVRIDIDLDRKPFETKRAVNAPTAAKKLFNRYLSLANLQCPLTYERCDEKKSEFLWSVGCNAKKNAFVFITYNPTAVPQSIVLRTSDRKVLTPTYRRVFSTDKGRSWRRMAFEPPHGHITNCQQPMPEPATIEVPPYSYQTVTVRLK